MLSTLSEIMQYKNAAILKRYEKDFPNNKLSADDAFYHVKKYLWLCQKHETDRKNNPNDESLQFVCSMYPEMREIDDMWHTFLIFTKDYADFCERYFGRFMHHAPRSDAEKYTEKYDPILFKTEFTRNLSYAYDHLGEETVTAWFSELIKEGE